jgi:diguanylate cyclase (GGDEF)-like protein
MTSPTLDRVFDAIVRVDSDFAIKFISEPGLRWLGGAAPTDLPSNFIDILHPNDVGRIKAACANKPEFFSCDVRMLKHGKEVWITIKSYLLPVVHQYMLCILDISPWKTDDSALRHAAEHDELTGLPNRASLKRTIENYINAGNLTFSVALLDLDGFKKVNDVFGHAVGDSVLIETTKRLHKVIGTDDMLARLGGDEFVLVLKEQDTLRTNSTLTNILLALGRPYDTAPHDAYLGASIGIARYPEHGVEYSTLLKNADTAMYHSKNGGKNRISIYTESNESEDFSLKSAIHSGIQEGEFFLEYQPQFDINRKLIGAEALMRWSSHAFGRVPPDKFIPIVEENGLMPFLGKWALRYACHQLRKFQELMPDFVMSVNVSAIQFGGDDFDSLILDAIAEASIDPTQLILEITESTLMHSQEKTERALATLCEKGIRFSIDDFGTGFSSLAYLTRLPVSSIKIDKTFVRTIGEPKNDSVSDQKLINAMINLAHSIDLEVVAEGVENEAQFSFLKKSGCNLIQGYLLGKPMSAEAIVDLLAHGTEQVA